MSLGSEPCRCVRCGACRGNGQTEYRTGSYPEWDLETCEHCGGTGITEVCERCQLLRELDYDQETA